MREILFRGKSKHGKWYYGFYTEGYYLDGTPVSWIEVVDRKKKETDSPTVLPETVGQFTGLTDKNGKKIFEGDIVEGANFTAEDGGYGVVSFVDGAFEVNGNDVTGTFRENYWGREFEVIGNIHDNPELLEVQDGTA